MINDNNTDILCITETWLKSYDTSSIASLLPDKHVFHHHPRNEKKGGGVGVAISKRFTGIKSTNRISASFECIEVSFTCDNDRFILYVLYKPPQICANEFIFEFESFLTQSELMYGKKVYLGDFNMWFDKSSRLDVRNFVNILEHFRLKNFVTNPTHDSGHILDLVIADAGNPLINNIAVEPVSTISDHRLISFNIVVNNIRTHEKTVHFRNYRSISCYDFSNAIVSRYYEENHFQNCEHAGSAVDKCVSCLANAYRNITSSYIEKNAPLIKKIIPLRDGSDSWYNSEIREAKRIMRKAEKNYIRFKTDNYRDEFRRAKQAKCDLVKSTKTHYYKNEISRCSNDSSKLYKLLKHLLGKKSADNILPDYTDKVKLANDFSLFFISKVEIINDSFHESVQSNGEWIPDFPLIKFDTFKQLDVDEVLKILENINKTNCKNDPFNIRKLSFDVVSPSLAVIFKEILSNSFASGLFPSSEKFAFIRPQIKAGKDPEQLSSYRPLYNTSFLSKLLESACLSQLLVHLKKFESLPKFQSAYREFHSVETAITKVYNDLVVNKAQGKCSLLILLDLSAAFDTVQHSILMNDLRILGLDGKVLSWFESYLSDREFKVHIEDSVSGSKVMRTGVPQGSVLGPILFLIYTIELHYILQNLGVSFHCYADDTQIYLKFSNIEEAEATVNNVYTCIKTLMNSRRLMLNTGKTECLLISSNTRYKIHDDITSVTIDGECIEMKNLGVVIDNTLYHS